MKLNKKYDLFYRILHKRDIQIIEEFLENDEYCNPFSEPIVFGLAYDFITQKFFVYRFFLFTHQDLDFWEKILNKHLKLENMIKESLTILRAFVSLRKAKRFFRKVYLRRCLKGGKAIAKSLR